MPTSPTNPEELTQERGLKMQSDQRELVELRERARQWATASAGSAAIRETGEVTEKVAKVLDAARRVQHEALLEPMTV